MNSMLQNSIYLQNQQKTIKTPEKVEKFMEEIEAVCRKYGYSISHEDGHGSFLIEPFSEQRMDWFYCAGIDFPNDNEELKQWLEDERKRVEEWLPPECCYAVNGEKECEYFRCRNNTYGTSFDCDKFKKELMPRIPRLSFRSLNTVDIKENIQRCQECILWEQEKKKGDEE